MTVRESVKAFNSPRISAEDKEGQLRLSKFARPDPAFKFLPPTGRACPNLSPKSSNSTVNRLPEERRSAVTGGNLTVVVLFVFDRGRDDDGRGDDGTLERGFR